MTELSPIERSARELSGVLQEKVTDVYGTSAKLCDLTKLSAGASRETWSFDVETPDEKRIPLILKRDPVHYHADGTLALDSSPIGVSRITEGKLVELAATAGVPIPEVPFYLEENEHTTNGFIMHRLEGETLGRRILRREDYTDARAKLAYQCGQAAARIHQIPLDTLPELPSSTAEEVLASYGDQLHAIDHPYPGFEYGLRWLNERLELAGDRYTLVHGDFRNGNIIVDENGLRAVLDWEIAYLGNPINDLAWLCVPSWRYGHFSKRVGGFGDVEDLLAGYRSAGGPEVSLESLRFWEVYGCLRWGIMCVGMGFRHLDGPHPSLELAAIGRRTAETEYDLLQLID